MSAVQVLVVADRLLRDLLVGRWGGDAAVAVVPDRGHDAWEDLAARADVVVLDLGIHPPRWERSVERLREHGSGPRVVALAGQGDESSALPAARCGVAAWLPYGTSLDTLTETVLLVHQGHAVYPSRLLGGVLEGMRDAVSEARRPTGRLSALTEREIDVLRALVEGLSARDVADLLDVAVNTVRTHTHRIFRKLGAHDRLEAVRIARAEGLAPRAEPADDPPTPTPMRLVPEQPPGTGRSGAAG